MPRRLCRFLRYRDKGEGAGRGDPRHIANHLTEHPAVLKGALEAYLKMSPEQREHAGENHELRCTGHGLNLTTDDAPAKSEKPTAEESIERYRAALVIT